MGIPRSTLSPPPAPVEYVQRGDEWCADALRRRLTVVVAGPGFGKSTLLGGWASSAPSAWYTASPADADMLRFAQGLAEALSLEPPTSEQPPEVIATEFLEALEEAHTDELLLVVDDAHELGTDGASVELLRALVQQAPAFLHIAVGSRTGLPFSIERLRGQGHVLSIDAAQLRFDPTEVTALVVTSLGGDAAELADAVYRLTEGWPAAVRLAVESLRPLPPELRPDALAGAARPGGSLFAYLADEVLRNEAPEVRNLLDAVAPLDAFTYELCRHLGFPEAEETLDGLARRGLFLDAHGSADGWLRLHALVREAVAARLPELSALASRRQAAEWLEAQGLFEEALNLQARIGDAEGVVRVISANGIRLIQRGSFASIVEAAAILPSDFAEPVVETAVGDAYHCLGDDRAATRWFDRAAAHGGAPGLRFRRGLLYPDRPRDALAVWDVESLRDDDDHAGPMLIYAALATMGLGDLPRARAYAERALTLTLEDVSEALVALGAVAYSEGNPDEARALFERAFAQTDDRSTTGRTHAMLRLGYVALDQGRYADALEFAQTARARTSLAIFVAWAHFECGECFRRLGRLDDALEEFEAARSVYARLGYVWEADVLAAVGAIHAERGSLVFARAAYERALPMAEATGIVELIGPFLAGYARVQAFDDPPAAAALAERAIAFGSVYQRYVDALLAAGWVALAAGDEEGAVTRARAAEAEAHRRQHAAGLAEALELHGVASRSAAYLHDALGLWNRQQAAVGSARVELALARLEGSPDDEERARARLLELGIRPEAAAGAAGTYAVLAPRTGDAIAITTLGGFRVLRQGRPVTASDWQSRKARDVLKILVANRGRPVTRDALMEMLWPEQAAAPLANRLNVLLTTVRSVLDPEKAFPSDHFVAAKGGAVALDLDHVQVDVERFLTLAEHGPSAEQAEQFYGGDFLVEDLYEDWATPLRDEARSVYVGLVRSLARRAAERNDVDAAVHYLQRILERDPYDEDAHLTLVTTLREAGRHGEARRRYLAYSARMHEIDVEPAPFTAP